MVDVMHAVGSRFDAAADNAPDKLSDVSVRRDLKKIATIIDGLRPCLSNAKMSFSEETARQVACVIRGWLDDFERLAA